MIVTVESDHGAAPHRMIFFRVVDDAGGVHSYGPVITSDPGFDAQAHCAVVAEKMAESLAAAEFEQVIG